MAIKITVEVSDDARPDDEPLKMEVTEDGYGVAVSVKNEHGCEVGRVAMDFYDNQLKALVYKHDDAEPQVTLLSADVDESFREYPKREEPKPAEPEPPAKPTLRWGRTHKGKIWHVVCGSIERRYPNATEGAEKQIHKCSTQCGMTVEIFGQPTAMPVDDQPAPSPGSSTVCPQCIDFRQKAEEQRT